MACYAAKLASLLLGPEHALVSQAATTYPGGCTVGEIATQTALYPTRVEFLLWDLHNNGLGRFEPPVFTATANLVLEEAVDGIACAELRRCFDCALK